MTRAEAAYLGRITDAGCCLCRHLGLGETPAAVHHPRRGTGAGRRAPHLKAIPLCYQHHQGSIGVHGLGVKRFEREYGITEEELWERYCRT